MKSTEVFVKAVIKKLSHMKKNSLKNSTDKKNQLGN